MSAPYYGDYAVDAVVTMMWNTNAQDGASITRSTDGTLKIYKSHATEATWETERSSLNGVTQNEDFDANTGVHGVRIDLSDNTDAGFYAAGNEYQVVMSGMTIDTKSVNAVIGTFSIERAGGALALLKNATYGLAQLVRSTTPANTLSVDASNKIAVPDTQKVDINTIKTQTVTCGAGVTVRADVGAAAAPGAANGMLIGGSNAATTFASLSITGQLDAGNILVDTTTVFTGVITATAANDIHGVETTGGTITTVGTTTNLTNLPSIPGNWITAAGINAGAITNAKFAAGAIDAAAIATGAIDADAIADGAIDAASIAAAALNGKGDWNTTTPPTVGAIADQVWDEAIAGHLGAGSTGLALNSAASAGDPWNTALPGAYGAGTAGKIVGDNLNATMTSRAPASTALTNATWTDPKAAFLDEAISAAKTLTAGERNSVATALLDLANGVETGYTVRQTLRIMAAVLAGKVSGYPAGPGVFRNLADAADRVSATNDANGNRTAMTLTP